MYGVSSIKATVEDGVYQANNERLFILYILVFPVRYFKALKSSFWTANRAVWYDVTCGETTRAGLRRQITGQTVFIQGPFYTQILIFGKRSKLLESCILYHLFIMYIYIYIFGIQTQLVNHVHLRKVELTYEICVEKWVHKYINIEIKIFLYVLRYFFCI